MFQDTEVMTNKDGPRKVWPNCPQTLEQLNADWYVVRGSKFQLNLVKWMQSLKKDRDSCSDSVILEHVMFSQICFFLCGER